ncbi:hypothetical protein OAH18_00570 [bacterium]|nr:hypothetical protein [bacterium]
MNFEQGHNMSKPMKLTLGVDNASPTMGEEEERIAILRATIEKYIPDFATKVAESAAEQAMLILHQDAFAVTYQDDEYALLGMAIKYAGLHGVRVEVTGSNGETC